jgi:type I restriction enzyme S subunit
MKEGWENKKLNEICAFVRGPFGGSLKKNIFKSDGYAVYEQQHAIYDQFDDIRYFIDETKFNEMKRFELNSGDLIMSCSGTMGKIAIVPANIKEGIINQALLKLTPSKKVDTVFLKLWLESESFQESIKKHSGGAAIQNVASVAILKQIEIQLPPLPKQQRIVSIIGEAFEAIDKAIENTQKNLQNAKELFESYLNSVFENVGEDWVNKRLQDVAFAFGRGKSKHRPRNWEGLFNGIYPFIQTGEVRNANKYIETYEKSYNDVGLAQSKLWLKGTICITIAANIAETAILAIDACIPDSIIGLQINPQKANLDFTYYLLQHYRTELQKLGKGSAQDNLNLGSFDNLYFPFPSVKEQIEIVSKLDALMAESEQLQIIYRQKLRDLEELKRSVLNKAFAGEL